LVAVLVVRGHAFAGTAHESRVELHLGRLDAQPPTARHRVAHVGHQIDDHLLEPDVAGGPQHDDQLDVGGNQPTEHRLQFADRVLRVEDARRHHLLPAEGEELTGQPGGPLGGVADDPHVAERGILKSEAALENLGSSGQHCPRWPGE